MNETWRRGEFSVERLIEGNLMCPDGALEKRRGFIGNGVIENEVVFTTRHNGFSIEMRAFDCDRGYEGEGYFSVSMTVGDLVVSVNPEDEEIICNLSFGSEYEENTMLFNLSDKTNENKERLVIVGGKDNDLFVIELNGLEEALVDLQELVTQEMPVGDSGMNTLASQFYNGMMRVFSPQFLGFPTASTPAYN